MKPQDAEPVARVQAQQDRARTLIRDIEYDGLKFFEQRGSGDLIDVTSEHLREKTRDLQTLDDMLTAWRAVCG
jgi:hypothetical protein